MYVRDANKINFSHNGEVFDALSLIHLFYQKSQKRNKLQVDPNHISIGRFGTGFLTTHLLSKVVEIKGVFKISENKYTNTMDIMLDRSKDEKNIQNNLDIFLKKLEDLKNSD